MQSLHYRPRSVIVRMHCHGQSIKFTKAIRQHSNKFRSNMQCDKVAPALNHWFHQRFPLLPSTFSVCPPGKFKDLLVDTATVRTCTRGVPSLRPPRWGLITIVFTFDVGPCGLEVYLTSNEITKLQMDQTLCSDILATCLDG